MQPKALEIEVNLAADRPTLLTFSPSTGSARKHSQRRGRTLWGVAENAVCVQLKQRKSFANIFPLSTVAMPNTFH